MNPYSESSRPDMLATSTLESRMIAKLKSVWFFITHGLEITDSISGRIDRLKLD